MTPNTMTVVACGGQVSCDIEGEAIILNLDSGVYYGLNPVGARIWDLIQVPRTVREVRDAVLNEYEVEPMRFEHELMALLRELETEGLIEVNDGTNA
jgi:hypothetical protein